MIAVIRGNGLAQKFEESLGITSISLPFIGISPSFSGLSFFGWYGYFEIRKARLTTGTRDLETSCRICPAQGIKLRNYVELRNPSVFVVLCSDSRYLFK